MTTCQDNVAVVGAGRMGRGIAVSFALAGYTVDLIDSEERSVGEFVDAAATIESEVKHEARLVVVAGIAARQAIDDMTSRINIVARADSAGVLRAADYVFEAVAEISAVKQSTYAWLSSTVGDATILASTTSTMLSDTLADFVMQPRRFTNAHWLNPAYLMPLIEISPAKCTAADVVDELRELLEAIGKVPVVCRASPGYMVSRLQALVLNEAVRLVEEGVASAADVDRAIRVGFGPRYTVFGPLEFIDWGGGDILYYASNYLASTIAASRFAPPETVKRNMEAGRNGMREGQGFYAWHDVDLDAFRADKLTSFANLLGHLQLLPKVSSDRDV